MNSVSREIFKAIHEGKWLDIEYRNQKGEITQYWICVENIDVQRKSMAVKGLHLGEQTICDLTVYIDSIIRASVLDGTYCAVNQSLVDDIIQHRNKYALIFPEINNFKILDYLNECLRFNNSPYKQDYTWLKGFDADSFNSDEYKLSPAEAAQLIKFFCKEVNEEKKNRKKYLAANVLSINTKRGLYVLAYKRILFDVLQCKLVLDPSINVCRENSFQDDDVESARLFLDEDDFDLLDDFENNLEAIKDRITENLQDRQSKIGLVDDSPYIMELVYDIVLDIQDEINAILEMYEKGAPTEPIKAFFGELSDQCEISEPSPFALLNDKVNLDQLLAIHNAMSYPLAFVQGPPGTGKTNTIINAISTAFFNGRTVLFSSYNNHPIESVFKKLTTMKYGDNIIPFPVLRLGKRDVVGQATIYMRELYEKAKTMSVYEFSLMSKRNKTIRQTKQLTELLEDYDKYLDLKQREEVIVSMLQKTKDLTLCSELQAHHLPKVRNELKRAGKFTDEDVKRLINIDLNEYNKFLNYTSAQFIQRLSEDRYNELREIIYLDNENERIDRFNRYITVDENLADLLKVFPVIITTSISAHRLGDAKPNFDIVIIDEASQCDIASAIPSIIRAKSLMLVGDPQQLQPVILLDENKNRRLMSKYSVPEEYNFIKNSIYKLYLAVTTINDEVLLSNHYRCHKKIIGFNNEKYYNKKLKILTKSEEKEPLVYVDVGETGNQSKNTSIRECDEIIKYILLNRDKEIGIITPFVKQKKLLTSAMAESGINNVTCGTVHSFQGDEKDVILFSLALSKSTGQKTYDWLKNNKELINVAVSRAKNKIVMFASDMELERLHMGSACDDLYELAQYIKSNGNTKITTVPTFSRALGVKPFSSEIENAFMESLSNALGNIDTGSGNFYVQEKVKISDIFEENITESDLYYKGHFDFVIFESTTKTPVIAFEVNGIEHMADPKVRRRDLQKKQICEAHNFKLITVANSYARRYNYIKSFLKSFFAGE